MPLPNSYKQALAALKAQAAAVGDCLKDGDALEMAQSRMSKYPTEVAAITRAALSQRPESAVSIPDMSESQLAALLKL